MNPIKYLESAAKTSAALILTTGILLSANQAYAADVSQTPLLLGGGNIPGNLALVPSVEFPTVISVANIATTYSSTTVFTGYFDPGKCYAYSYNATESLRHFYPTRFSSSRECTVANEWSGNFLNWAATQTVDPFRSVLTGGYRVVDTATDTQLEKARFPLELYGYTGNFPNRRLPESGNNTTLVEDATPFSKNNMQMRVAGLNNQMAFSLNGDGKLSEGSYNAANFTAYNPATAITNDKAYLVSIRVKVCVAGLLEPNCKQYGSNWKPEGLIQEYSKDIRYSAFSYLADDNIQRDGGVLRANQKFVGPTLQNGTANSAAEWSSSTGIFITNPNPTDATATGVNNSGVINYINKFGQNANALKTFDPVSELYYAATRYFKKLGDVPAYSTVSGNQHDFFPVIKNWEDPIQYSCQKNVILGIGDTNTHADRNLPGGTRSGNEPSLPTEVSADNTVDATKATLRVGALEGVGSLNADSTNQLGSCCNNNSAYIAGVAYDSNTKDIRPTLPGKQTISTHWVDVLEYSTLRSRTTNQYWLAAKYGGFKIPTKTTDPDYVADYGDPYTGTVPIKDSWWTSGELQSNGEKRPNNFYIASDAIKMVESLRLAFKNIADDVKSTTASLATNSTRLGTDTAVYQSLLDSGDWSGDLLAMSVDTNGVVNATPSWKAAAKMEALTASQITSRKIFTNTIPTGTTGGPFISVTGSNFSWSGLNTTQKTLITEDQLNFIRGDRTKEQTVTDKTKPFRKRGSRLGDIVNSDPQFIHTQNFGYSRLTWNKGTVVGGVADDYVTYRASNSYKTKTPLVIVGANDGMLHGFNANLNTTGGEEVFAYVPSSVIANLKNLSDPNYTHRYYVDATPRVGDYWTGTAWKTMVVGATGAGGKSVFALDITNPGSMSSSSVMWEFTHPRLGYTLGQPTLVALPNEKFGVIISSGASDTTPTTDGKVWILDANNGSVLKEFDLPTTGDLGAVLASDTDYDFVADRLYVGDTLGNVWRLDMSKDNSGNLVLDLPAGLKQGTTNKPLFIVKDAAGNRQPITAPLTTAFDNNVHMVYFGTGSFYKVGDNEVPTNPPVQTFYGIEDKALQVDGRGSLLQQKITLEATLASGNTARQVSDEKKSSSQKGWLVDLAWQTADGGPGPKGERVVARATLRNDRVIFTTLIPAADPCAFGGSSFIMSLSRATGARLTYAFFDSDGNKLINDNDSLLSNGNRIPWSGLADPDEGAIKGIVSLYRWICFAGSSGNTPTCVPVSGSQTDGRKSWREIRPN